jgi:spore coat polysaccharide biosynthesis predicted glycosyltransferase SpsG
MEQLLGKIVQQFEKKKKKLNGVYGASNSTPKYVPKRTENRQSGSTIHKTHQVKQPKHP